jgi:uncharacterized membrane protein YkvA (DUF1232 family)
MSLINPKTAAERGAHILLSWGLLAAAVFYTLNTIDIIPDANPLGFLDDAIVITIFLSIGFKIWARVSTRFKGTWGALKKYHKNHSLIELILKPGFWLTALLLGLSIAYFQWTFDLLPDVSGFGFIDDTIAILGALAALIRFYEGRQK